MRLALVREVFSVSHLQPKISGLVSVQGHSSWTRNPRSSYLIHLPESSKNGKLTHFLFRKLSRGDYTIGWMRYVEAMVARVMSMEDANPEFEYQYRRPGLKYDQLLEA